MASRTSASTRRAGGTGRQALRDRADLFLMMAVGLMAAAGIGWGAEATHELFPWVLILAVGVVAVGGLLTDLLGGLAVGLVGAAIVGGSQLIFNHTAVTRAPYAYVATLALLVVLGGITGTAADRLRRDRRRQERAEALAVLPAEGSLGLLGLDDARLRLAEELARARRYGHPLSVVTLRVLVDPQGLSPDDVRRARRAVARVLESGLRSTDTPYVIDDETFGALLPETSADNARLVADSLAAEARDATFADRTDSNRRPVHEVAELRVGVETATETEAQPRDSGAPDGEALLVPDREALRPVPTDDAAVRRRERA